MIKSKLLIISNDPDIQHIFLRLENLKDYEILIATNTEEGLAILATHQAQIVVSDDKIPPTTGLAFLHQVKTLYPNIIRILLCDHVNLNLLKNAINDAYVYKILTKPLDSELLLEIIKEGFLFSETQKNTNPELLECKLIEGRLQRLAYQDELSELNNRPAFLENLKFFIKNAEESKISFALLHIDIDNLNVINNTLGRDAGDKVLKFVATVLKKIINDANKIARIESDTFAIIFPEIIKISDMKSLLQDLVQSIKKPIQLDNQKYYISVSIGISLYPTHGNSTETLMKHADLALQHSKILGGNNYQFYKDILHETPQSELEIEAALHTAIEKKQFELYYQPAFSINTKEIVGAEALLRWHHPTLGLLMPNKFIPLCESAGLIIPVGQWVVNAACQQIKQWHELGYNTLHVAINISVRQFNDPGLLDTIALAIKTAQIQPQYLILEITESVLMQNIKLGISILHALKKIGVTLASDDFGTGYSSLSYIHQFPFDALKIDKSFINNIDINPKSRAIVSAIIAMAKDLNFQTIAEGIERQAQLTILKKYGCDLVQGYLLSKPITAAEFTQLLQ